MRVAVTLPQGLGQGAGLENGRNITGDETAAAVGLAEHELGLELSGEVGDRLQLGDDGLLVGEGVDDVGAGEALDAGDQDGLGGELVGLADEFLAAGRLGSYD